MSFSRTDTPTARSSKLASGPFRWSSRGLPIRSLLGIVTSLAQPAGNFTGFTSFTAAIAAETASISEGDTPGIERIARDLQSTHSAVLPSFYPVTSDAGAEFGVALIEALSPTTPDRGYAGQVAGNTGDGVIVTPACLHDAAPRHVFALTDRHRVPTVSAIRRFAAGGELNPTDADCRRSVSCRLPPTSIRILRGEKARRSAGAGTDKVTSLGGQSENGEGYWHRHVQRALLATADEVIE